MTRGDVSARFKAEYDLLLTQKLILSPLLEMNLRPAAMKSGVGSA